MQILRDHDPHKMKFAIISDIHGNMEALRAVFDDIDGLHPDRIVCLGDCIGYGPESEQVLVEMRRRGIPTIIGNHEQVICEPSHLDWFNPQARASVKMAIASLSEASIAMIEDLPYSIVVEHCRCVHGYPPDDARTYLFQKKPYQLMQTFRAMTERVCFVGHTHDLELVQFDGRQVERRALQEGKIPLDPRKQYLINVGSVGQPRDGDNRAKYVIYDTDRHRLDVRCIPYDIGTTVKKIKAAGLPEAHADRLW